MTNNKSFTSLDDAQLATVSGGAARVAASAKSSDLDSKLQTMLSGIVDAIKELGKPKGNDPMMMMMMMMMMGGGGGGSAPPPPPPPPSISVNVRR
jgi:hypothetical protein